VEVDRRQTGQPCSLLEGASPSPADEPAPTASPDTGAPSAEELSFTLSLRPSTDLSLLARVPRKVRKQIEHELRLINDLNYAPYFLTVQDLVVYARSRGILCQGRGAAANSAVCYCLGVTA